jgi:hypothetical protein
MARGAELASNQKRRQETPNYGVLMRAETASQVLHRLTSYDVGWYEANRSSQFDDWPAPVRR